MSRCLFVSFRHMQIGCCSLTCLSKAFLQWSLIYIYKFFRPLFAGGCKVGFSYSVWVSNSLIEVKMSRVRFFEYFAGIDEFFQYFAVGIVEDVKEGNFVWTDSREIAADKEIVVCVVFITA